MNNIKKIIAAVALIASSGVSAGVFSPDVAYDAPDANTADGLCKDAQGRCTLRAAIQQAKADDDFSFIMLTEGMTYRLNSTLKIESGVTILGHRGGSMVLNAPTITAATGNNIRILEINAPGEQVSIFTTRITGGKLLATSNGGGIGGAGITIRQGSTVALDRVEVAGNFADRLSGGGIYNDGNLQITQSNISNNQVSDLQARDNPQLYLGGGLVNTGQLKITGSSFVNNSARVGGAIASTRGSIDDGGATTTLVYGSTFYNNRASFDGAAIYSDFSEVDIVGSTIVNNGKNTSAESGKVLLDVAAISTPFGDARFDPTIAGSPEGGELIFGRVCASCHATNPIKANRYTDRALFAYIDSKMSQYSNCTGACAQSVTAYLLSSRYAPAANLPRNIIFHETPDTYVATSIVVNEADDVAEYKKGLSRPKADYTLWGDLPFDGDVVLSDFAGGGTYGFPGELTWSEEAALDFTLTPVTTFPGINVVVAKPVAGTNVWRESVTFGMCKDVALRSKLASYNLSPYCRHGEVAGNARSGRARLQQYAYGSYTFSLGAWEDNTNN